MNDDRRLLTASPGGMTESPGGIDTKIGSIPSRLPPHLLASAAVVAAFVFTLEPPGWIRSTLFFAVLLAVFLVGVARLRVAATWPASLVVLTFMGVGLIAARLPEFEEAWEWEFLYLPVTLLVGVLVCEAVALRATRKPLSKREAWLCGVFGLVLLWFVVLPAVESWASQDDLGRILAVMLLVVTSRGVVASGASVRTALRSRPLFGALVVAIVMILAAQLTGLWVGVRPPTRQAPTPMVIAHEVRDQFAYHFPRWKSDPETLDGKWTQYRGELATASLSCSDADEPCFEMLHVLRNLLGDFRNGHTGLRIPAEMALPPVSIVVTDEGVGIESVRAGSAAEDAGVAPGQRVIAIDGMAVEEAAKRIPTWRLAYAASHKREYESYGSILLGRPDTVVALTIEMSDGATRTVQLKRESVGASWEQRFDESYEPELWSSVEDDGIGWIWIEGLDGPTMAERFEDAMSQMEGTAGLVIDLRGNGGGSVELTLEMVGYFLREPTILGHDCGDAQDDDLEFYCVPQRVDPVAQGYSGRVAVLIDEDVFSAAELLTYGLCTAGDARCFGRRTAGETDCIVFHEIPGGRVVMATSEFRPVIGESIQGVGIEPDVRVGRTLEDLREGRDPVFETARDWLLSE